MAGAGLGTMTITSGASIAIAKYGWRYALRCMSVSSVVVFVCGLSFVPFKKRPKKLEGKKKLLQASAPRKMLKGTLKLFYDPRVWKNKAFAVWSLAIALIFFANFAPFIFLVGSVSSQLLTKQNRTEQNKQANKQTNKQTDGRIDN